MRATIAGRLDLFAWSDVADGQMAGAEYMNNKRGRSVDFLLLPQLIKDATLGSTEREKNACHWEGGNGVMGGYEYKTGTTRQSNGRREGGESRGKVFFGGLFQTNWAASTTRKPGECQCTNEKRGGWVRILISAMSLPPLRAYFREREGNPSEQQAITKMKIKCGCSAEPD